MVKKIHFLSIHLKIKYLVIIVTYLFCPHKILLQNILCIVNIEFFSLDGIVFKEEMLDLRNS